MVNNIEDTQLITLAEFREFMFQHIVPVDDLLDFEGRPLEKSFPYWRRHGLLPFVPTGKKLHISFIQLIWIRILDSLRTFSYTLENTKLVCDYFFKDAYENKLPELNFEYNIKMLKKKKVAGTLTEEDELMLNQLENMSKDKILMQGLKFDINYLSNLIISSITTNEEAGILIFLDGNIMEHLGSNYYSHTKEYKFNRSAPHIYLSVKYYFQEFVESDELAALLMPQILNDNEKNVLKEIRNRNINEIVITKKGAQIIKIEASKGGIITGEQAMEVRRVLGLRNYEDIKISTRDEKTLTFKSTRKKINSD
jgi:hypothetical protein